MSKLFKPILANAMIFAILASCNEVSETANEIYEKSIDAISNVVSFGGLDIGISIDEKSAYYEGENIELNFSLSMNTDSVEKIITLKKDSSSVDTDIVWQNGKCFVKPIGGFCLGQEYSFSMQGEVLASDGGAYTVDISRKFIFGNKEKIFILENTVAPNSKDSAIEFHFNKELDIASFEQEFKISPYIELKKEYAADKKTVCIVPADKWQNNTFYTWTLENVLSADKYKLNKTYSNTFMAVDANARPQVVCVCPIIKLDENLNASTATFLLDQDLSELSGKQPLGIVFDKPMDFDSVKSAIYFEPTLSGVLLQTDEYSFIYAPYDNYQIEKEYLLQINESAKDIYGLSMSEQKNFYFKSQDEFLKIKSVFAANVQLEKNKIVETEIAENGTLFASIIFSSSITEECFEKIESAIKLNVHFPNTSNPAKLNSITLNEKKNQIEICWNNLSCQQSGKDCVYELKILGGKNYLKTKIGEYLKEDECYYIRIKQSS